jgi:hypothetical protein
MAQGLSTPIKEEHIGTFFGVTGTSMKNLNLMFMNP